MPDESGANFKRLELKKYPNRRYYDTTHSRHLTLEEIRSLVQQGYDIVVTDAKTGEDITAQVLTQIILELETTKLNSFPVPLLVRLIRMNDQLVKDFIEKYFNQALRSFLDYQRQFEEQVRRAQGLSTAFPGVAAWTEAMLKPFVSRAQDSTKTQETPSPVGIGTQNAELRDMIHKLQQEIENLKKAGSKKRARRKRAGG
jgi:polyhydroxyalkanoate synthesis repressor PhaR